MFTPWNAFYYSTGAFSFLFNWGNLRIGGMNLMLFRKQGNPVTVYEPNHIIKAGVWIWADMFRELIAFRDLIL